MGRFSPTVPMLPLDTLVDLQLPEVKRKPDEGELVSMCGEFLHAGTDTTSTALKAIVLEGLRRHPPVHFVLPHAVLKDVEVNGYLIPKRAVVNFMVAEMGLDPEVWEDPMEFKPERFLVAGVREEKENERQVFDITCTKEIKMMPFGAGRRICPGANLALLHLEYFLANFIWFFEWKEVDGQEVDFSEKQEFAYVMKNPLNVHIIPRVKS